MVGFKEQYQALALFINVSWKAYHFTASVLSQRCIQRVWESTLVIPFLNLLQ